jgi:hypothetical protein
MQKAVSATANTTLATKYNRGCMFEQSKPAKNVAMHRVSHRFLLFCKISDKASEEHSHSSSN